MQAVAHWTDALLLFDTTVELDRDDRSEFATAVRSLYADVMQTATGHIAISIRACEPGGPFDRAIDG